MAASLFLVSTCSGQWTSEWTSSAISTATVSGWLSFQQTGNTWQQRFYTLDSLAFTVMTDAYSQSPAYSYTFTLPERAAGNYLFSLGLDLTGDGIVEFYVLGSYGQTSPYRQSFKIFDLTSGAVIFERDAPAYSYGEPAIWDVDNDGMYECVFARADYPSGENYANEVYSTNTPVAAADPGTAPPSAYRLEQNYPNPFNPATWIEYAIEEPGFVELVIFNATGQRVNTLNEGPRTPGVHLVGWNGRNARGEAAPTGPYFYQLKVNGQPQAARRMILLR